jgi:hypothetical protein
MTRRAHICPTCQRPFPPALIVTGSVRQKLVNIISHRPDGIPINELVDQVYADCIDGGPVTAPRSVNVMIHKANKQLLPQGYQIEAMWLGRGARYRMIRIGQHSMATIDGIFCGYRTAEQRILATRRGGIAPDASGNKGPKEP